MAKLEWNQKDPLALSEGETPQANQALHDYAFMGPGRSLTNLHRSYTDPAPNQSGHRSVPTTQLRTLKGWSASYDWQERVSRYDAQMQERERLAYEAKWAERREAEREETYQLAQQLREKAKQMLGFPLADVEQVTARRQGPGGVQHIDMTVVKPSRWSMRDVAQLADTASKLARLSADMPTDHVQIDGITPQDLKNKSVEELLLMKQQLEARRNRGDK